MRKGTGMRRLAAIALAAVMAAAAPHALAKTSEEDILLWLDGLDIGGPLPEASAVTAARGEGGEVAPGAADDEGDISDPAAQNYLGEQYCFVPVSVSFMNYVDVVRDNAAAFFTICVVSTVLCFAVTAWTVQLTSRLLEKRKGAAK